MWPFRKRRKPKPVWLETVMEVERQREAQATREAMIAKEIASRPYVPREEYLRRTVAAAGMSLGAEN